MSIYDRRQFQVGSTVVSAIKSDNPLHAGPGESRAEIVFSVGGEPWEILWVGHPADVGGVARWVRARLLEGFDIDTIDDVLSRQRAAAAAAA